MASFAKITEDNEVLQVLAVDDKDVLNAENVEEEAVGQAYLETHNNWPAHLWIQTSYNTHQNTHVLGGTPFRGNYAGIGYTWDAATNNFWPEQPYPSWIKNTTDARWDSPLGAEPTLTAEQLSDREANTHGWMWTWDETAYQNDNPTGWTLVDELA